MRDRVAVLGGFSYFAMAAIAVAALAALLYFRNGFGVSVFVLWLGSLAFAAIGIRKNYPRPHGIRALAIDRWDCTAIALLVLGFGVLYLWGVYEVPFQMSSDEVVVVEVGERLIAERPVDLFGLSGHFDFPSLSFIVLGALARALGGGDFFHSRLAHAIVGLAAIVLAYLFFRSIADDRRFAAGATLILGLNHAFFIFSRMALREDTALVATLASLFFLVRGVRRASMVEIFLGGAIAGLGFYVYASARIGVIAWGAFLATSLFILARRRVPAGAVFRLALISAYGFILVIIPFAVASFKAPSGTFAYSREQLLIFPEGQRFQQQWGNAVSVRAGIMDNIEKGLAMFNSRISDRGYMYTNPGHGFLDPLTGILLWLGFASMLSRIGRGDPEESSLLLIVSGFLASWLFMAFFTTKNPNYTRLLVLLPFVAVLAMEGIRIISRAVRATLHSLTSIRLPVASLMSAITIFGLIAGANASIVSDYVVAGILSGQDLGGTVRYVDARRGVMPYSFYVAADAFHPYFSWGTTGSWETWTRFSAGPDQRVTVVRPDELVTSIGEGSFTVFASSQTWREIGPGFLGRFPKPKISPITPDGRLIAVEVLAP